MHLSITYLLIFPRHSSEAIHQNPARNPCYNMLMLEKMKTQIRRFIFRIKRDIFNFYNIILTVAVIVALIWGYHAIGAMSRNWELEEKLRAHRLEEARLELEVEMLRLEQEYYQTDEYKELTARIKAGKMQPGETMVILPQNSKSAREKYRETAEESQPFTSNFSKWLDFLFG